MKAKRQDRLLKPLRPNDWHLRYPGRLLGIHSVLAVQNGLVLLADVAPSLEIPLLQDVFRLLRLTGTQIICTTPEKLTTLSHQSLLWSLGVAIPSWTRRVLSSPPLAELLNNSVAKRQLWQQIAYYVEYHPTDC
ncbi:MAG: DNA polymerase III subunit psi [Candidatus Symbiodolus clandestinus]